MGFELLNMDLKQVSEDIGTLEHVVTHDLKAGAAKRVSLECLKRLQLFTEEIQRIQILEAPMTQEEYAMDAAAHDAYYYERGE